MWYHVAFILSGFYLIGVGIFNIMNNEGMNFWVTAADAKTPANALVAPNINAIIVNTGVTFLGFVSIGFGVHGLTTGKDLVDTARSAAAILRQPSRDGRPPGFPQGGRRYGGKR